MNSSAAKLSMQVARYFKLRSLPLKTLNNE